MTQKKSRKVKCPVCGLLNHKEVAIAHGKRYYCESCLEEMLKEKEYYNELFDYICELYQIETLNGWMFKQIKDFKEKYGYTYRGMRTTLHYFYEILNNDPEDAMGIGIIPFVYDEAKQYYIDKKKISDSAKNITGNDIDKKKTIKIKKQDIEDNAKYKEMSIIDISDLT